jgi:hypothetical protein
MVCGGRACGLDERIQARSVAKMDMATENTRELIDRINFDDPVVRAEVEARLQYAKNVRGSIFIDPVEGEAWNALTSATSESKARPLQQLLDSRVGGNKTFVLRSLRQLSDYADEYSAKRLTRIERGIVMRLLVSCLVDYLKGWDDPPKLDASSLIRHIKRVPTAIDAAFPGYAAARLIDRVALMKRAA